MCFFWWCHITLKEGSPARVRALCMQSIVSVVRCDKDGNMKTLFLRFLPSFRQRRLDRLDGTVSFSWRLRRSETAEFVSNFLMRTMPGDPCAKRSYCTALPLPCFNITASKENQHQFSWRKCSAVSSSMKHLKRFYQRLKLVGQNMERALA